MDTRIIAVLLIDRGRAVVTNCFGRRHYIGDPRNIARIFSEQECDELIIKNISGSELSKGDFQLITEICGECTMPVGYGGNIGTVEIAKAVVECGADKIVLNRAYRRKEEWINRFADAYGEQALIASIDYRISSANRLVYEWKSGTTTRMSLESYLRELQAMPVGEILLSCVDLDGTRRGLDSEILGETLESLQKPLILNGGAGSELEIVELTDTEKLSGIGVGTYFALGTTGFGVSVDIPLSLRRSKLR